jgi:hypothetical protein
MIRREPVRVHAAETPPWAKVNEKARYVQGPDSDKVAALVDEVLFEHGISGDVAAAASSVRDRLIASEMDFQRGGQSTVTEENVVTVVNKLARKFDAPAYAYTTQSEVRRLRVKMLTTSPNLIGRNGHPHSPAGDFGLSNQLNPVEAFHVTATLLYQKVYNPDFQLSHAELVQNWADLHDVRKRRDILSRVAAGRTENMIKVIHDGAVRMSYRDILDQSEESLQLLGIN